MLAEALDLISDTHPAWIRYGLQKQESLSGADGLRRWRNLALGVLPGSLALDADQELFIEHRKDTVEHRDRQDMRTAFKFRDKGMRGASSPGDLLLGQIQLIAPLADVGSDPVLLAQRPDGRVVPPGACLGACSGRAVPGHLRVVCPGRVQQMGQNGLSWGMCRQPLFARTGTVI